MKLNLNIIPTDISGNVIPNAPTLAEILANNLSNTKSENPYKINALCERIIKEKNVDIDKADLDLLEKETTKLQLVNRIIALLIEQFNLAKIEK